MKILVDQKNIYTETKQKNIYYAAINKFLTTKNKTRDSQTSYTHFHSLVSPNIIP